MALDLCLSHCVFNCYFDFPGRGGLHVKHSFYRSFPAQVRVRHVHHAVHELHVRLQGYDRLRVLPGAHDEAARLPRPHLAGVARRQQGRRLPPPAHHLGSVRFSTQLQGDLHCHGRAFIDVKLQSSACQLTKQLMSQQTQQKLNKALPLPYRSPCCVVE